MNNPLESLLQQTGAHSSHFEPSSRYYGLEVKILSNSDFSKTAYVKRRFISQPEEYDLIEEHTVAQGDRIDNIAHQYLGDSEQFWRICDANAVHHPNELVKAIGDKIKITMPDGISATL